MARRRTLAKIRSLDLAIERTLAVGPNLLRYLRRAAKCWRSLPDDPEGRTYAEAIAQRLAEKALAGDIRAAQEIADRAEGRARQSIEIQNTALAEAFERMTREELLDYATAGSLPAWFPGAEGNASETIQ